MRIRHNTKFLQYTLPKLSVEISKSKEAAEIKLEKLNAQINNADFREPTEIELARSVSLAYFIVQLEDLEKAIIELRDIEA